MARCRIDSVACCVFSIWAWNWARAVGSPKLGGPPPAPRSAGPTRSAGTALAEAGPTGSASWTTTRPAAGPALPALTGPASAREGLLAPLGHLLVEFRELGLLLVGQLQLLLDGRV